MKKIKRILFVDDDVIIGLVSKRLLEHMQICDDIVVFSDSKKALDFIKENYHPKTVSQEQNTATLLFLDIDMPGYGCFELLALFKELAAAGELATENMYFVVVTSHIGKKEMARAQAFNVLDILEKPLQISQIEALRRKIEQ